MRFAIYFCTHFSTEKNKTYDKKKYHFPTSHNKFLCVYVTNIKIIIKRFII